MSNTATNDNYSLFVICKVMIWSWIKSWAQTLLL